MTAFHNRTRTSESIPARLVAEKRRYLLPLYYLLRTSDLAREGVNHSASYRFADHVYAARPSGRLGIGFLLDAILLQFPAARAMRFRYLAARREIVRFVHEHSQSSTLDVLAVPCGMARELFEAADILHSSSRTGQPTVRWHGIDLDEGLVAQLESRAGAVPFDFRFWSGDALLSASYRDRPYSMVVSTGFTEFLGDEQVLSFFQIVRYHLDKGGLFFTSAMKRHRLSDYLLRTLAEIETHYRTEDDIATLIKAAGFSQCTTYTDTTKLQTIVLATP